MRVRVCVCLRVYGDHVYYAVYICCIVCHDRLGCIERMHLDTADSVHSDNTV